MPSKILRMSLLNNLKNSFLLNFLSSPPDEEIIPNFTNDLIYHNLKNRKNSSKDWLFNLNHHEFLKNIQNYPALKTYKPEKVSYEFNSLGFRSIEFENNNSAFPKILYGGCSYTEGTFISQEHIWGNILNSLLFNNSNMPFYNCGLLGNSINAIVRQLIVLLNISNFKPDLIILCLPSFERNEIIYLDEQNKNSALNFVPNKPLHKYRGNAEHKEFDEFLNRMIHSCNDRSFLTILKDSALNFLLLDLFLTANKIPYIITTWQIHRLDLFAKIMMDLGLSDNFIDAIFPKHYFNNNGLLHFNDIILEKNYEEDIALDFLHPGPNSHFAFAKDLYQKGKDKIFQKLNKEYSF